MIYYQELKKMAKHIMKKIRREMVDKYGSLQRGVFTFEPIKKEELIITDASIANIQCDFADCLNKLNTRAQVTKMIVV